MSRISKTLAVALPLLAALAGCAGGDDAAAKAEPVTKSSPLAAAEGAGTKAGARSGAVKQAQAFTAANTDVASKSVDRIEVGQTRSGALTGEDPTLDDGSHIDFWELRVPGQTAVEITLTSSEFDAYLMLATGAPGGAGEMLADDDDGAGGTDARLAGTLEPGTYTIAVNSFGGGATGAYQLGVEDQGGSGASGSDGSAAAVQGRIESGATVSGRLDASAPTLDDGSHYHIWHFTGQAGEDVTIDLMSDEFDAYVMLGEGMNPQSSIGDDDDGGEGLDSRLTMALPGAGVYSIVVNTAGSGETGAYQLRLQSSTRDYSQMYPGNGDPSGKYAVVVGIDDYPGTSNDLRGPVDDAELARAVLVDRFGFPEENIVVLRDVEATRAGIANAVARHLGQAGPDGTAVFFYSGHGTRLDENLGLTGRHDPEGGNDVDEALAVHGGMILDEELGFLLQQIRAENTLVVIDACFSGTSTRGGPDAMAKFIALDQADSIDTPSKFITADLTTDFGFGTDPEAFTRAMSNPDRHVLLAASSEDELSWAIGSWPDRDGPASLFTYFWAKVMRHAPTSTTFSQVHAMVSDSVNRYVRQNRNLDTQTVQIMGPNQGASIGAFLGAN